MSSLSSEDEADYRFFDAHDDIVILSDSESDCPECHGSDVQIDEWESNCLQYDLWKRNLISVPERRSEFFRLMGLTLNGETDGDAADLCNNVMTGETNRIMENSGSILGNAEGDGCLSSSHISEPGSSNNSLELHKRFASRNTSTCRLRKPDAGAVCNEDNLGQNSISLGVGRMATAEDFDCTSASSSSTRQSLQRLIWTASDVVPSRRRMSGRWLSRLRSMKCIADRERSSSDTMHNTSNSFHGSRVQRVKVRQYKKRTKELSALFTGQDIQAHDGSILTMKFSPDGQYLASAGEDKIIRIWQVIEDERSNEIDIPDIDPSCIYFTVNHLSQLTHLVGEKEKISKFKALRKTADSACVIFPPKVFRILEKSIFEFHGHGGEILDLTWSNTNCLLSSSIDKTVRLWRVGHDQCVEVFPHCNYVTSVQFNPVNDNFFISGSIDGKVRIWDINNCQVVDWIDVRDIVTAVVYQPDGKGGIIGSLTGNCHFFKLVDYHFNLDAQVSLNSKRKSNCKRISGFQFFPQDNSKVMVTCGDSQIRILDGVDLIGKYKGPRSAVNQISAFFTSDGKHVISACEDSSVYVWNTSNQEEFSVSHPKTIRSFESFEVDASVAIPWYGLKSGVSENGSQFCISDENFLNQLPVSSSTCFSLGQDFCLESIPKGSATWPEENLPSSSPRAFASKMFKSQYKFLKTSCQSISKSHAWGLVIVTAGWDGRIRFFQNHGLPTTI